MHWAAAFSTMDQPDRETFVADAMQIAAEQAGTEKEIVFDGCHGAINVTRAMTERLIALRHNVIPRAKHTGSTRCGYRMMKGLPIGAPVLIQMLLVSR